MKTVLLYLQALWLVVLSVSSMAADVPAASDRPATGMVRIGAAQPKARLLSFEVSDPQEARAHVDRVLDDLEMLVAKAAADRCDVLAFPEDTLGLGHWEAAHHADLQHVLPGAVQRMLERLGRAAAKHALYIVCCNDTFSPEGSYRNTAFFIGRDGRLIGSYHKVNMPIHELVKERGTGFPVFPTPDLGTVGMLICYDMVFPEAARCLALGGADIIFHPTLGGAAIGDEDISRAAFRTRAVENFVYLVVSQRGRGSMIISPKGQILAEGKEPDSIAVADIDPFGNRQGGDAMNQQADMRARLFRERSPTAFSILTDPNPPVLAKVPSTMTIEEAVEISGRTLTKGEQEFKEAEALERAGKTAEAIQAYQRLQKEYRQTWIDRVSTERLARLRNQSSKEWRH